MKYSTVYLWGGAINSCRFKLHCMFDCSMSLLGFSVYFLNFSLTIWKTLINKQLRLISLCGSTSLKKTKNKNKTIKCGHWNKWTWYSWSRLYCQVLTFNQVKGGWLRIKPAFFSRYTSYLFPLLCPGLIYSTWSCICGTCTLFYMVYTVSALKEEQIRKKHFSFSTSSAF